MRKFRVILVFFVVIHMLLVFCGCGGAQLSAPDHIDLDSDYNLTWDEVENARSYKLEIVNADSGTASAYSTRKPTYSLSKLGEGDYDVRIMAIGSESAGLQSAWSKVFSFHRDYETGCLYTLYNSGREYQLTRVGTCAGDVLLEDVYRGKPVTSIADGAFKGSIMIENVTIGNNTVSIGDKAFYNCSKLKSVTMSDKVLSIGLSCFQSCRALETVRLSASLVEIPQNAFAYCRALNSLSLGGNVVAIADYAFSDCSSLTELVIPDSVRTIGTYAFSGNALVEKIYIGKEVVSIADYAFYGCAALEKLTFGEESRLSSIGEYAFAECAKLASVSLPDGIEVVDYAGFYHDVALKEISIPDSLYKLGAYAFAATAEYSDQINSQNGMIYIDKWLVFCPDETLSELTELSAQNLREGTIGIADQVFKAAPKLETVNLPDSVRYIGESAFRNCAVLWKVVLPENGVQYIWNAAFYGCSNLLNLSIGSGLLSIGDQAFMKCSKLDNGYGLSALLPDTVINVGYQAFKGTALFNRPDEYGVIYAGNWVVGYSEYSVLKSIVLDKNTIGIANYAFYNCSSLTNITGPGIVNVRHLGYAAFYNCSSLSSISLNDSLTEIRDYTFYKCSSLYRITLPADLQTIGRAAFYKCISLSEVDMSFTAIESIGINAFYGCINLTNVTFGDRLTAIGESAFSQCEALVSVELPDSLTDLGANAFKKNYALSSVTFGNSLTAIGDSAFRYCTSLTRVVLPENLTTIGRYAFANCSALSEAVFNDGLISVGDYAFYKADLASLSFPDTLESIGGYAFVGNKRLTSVVLGELSAVGAHAFYGCTATTFYCVADRTGEGWNERWNTSWRPVVFGCILSEDGTYVVGLTIGENSFLNTGASNGLSVPEREGYTFVGWSVQNNSVEAEYAFEELSEIPVGTTIYAVWRESNG